MVLRISKYAKAGHAFFLISLLYIPVAFLVDPITVDEIIGIIALLSANILIIPTYYSQTKINDREVYCDQNLQVFGKTIVDKKTAIRWEDITSVDGYFGLLPPYHLTIRGLEADTREEMTFEIERLTPDVDHLHTHIAKYVDPDALSPDYKENVDLDRLRHA